MIEYVKSEQEDNVYCILRRDMCGHTVLLEQRFSEPVNGEVVGTYAVYESGYCPIQGITYDEVSVDFYGKE